MSQEEEGDVFIGEVKDLSGKGLGIVSHPEGRIFFVPGVWPGDRGTFKVEKLEKRYGFASLQSLEKSSEGRVSPPCAHQGFEKGLCGGCPWMIASYPSQLQQKQKRIQSVGERAGLFSTAEVVKGIWPSEQVMGYRNRAQFKTDGTQIGFVTAESKELAPIKDCQVLTETNRKTLQELIEKLPNEDWIPRGAHKWNFLEIDEQVKSNQVVQNRRRPFQQANSLQNERMKEWLRKSLEKYDRSDAILELFAGSGNFTRVFSEMEFKTIRVVEVEKQSISSIHREKLSNVQGIVADLYIPTTWGPIRKSLKKPDILVLDPPREGFKKIDAFIDAFSSIRDIFYVSCDLMTFVRDAKLLIEKGWALDELQPLDQFPHTPHVELLAFFRKK